jgi:hypothetical protein
MEVQWCGNKAHRLRRCIWDKTDRYKPHEASAHDTATRTTQVIRPVRSKFIGRPTDSHGCFSIMGIIQHECDGGLTFGELRKEMWVFGHARPLGLLHDLPGKLRRVGAGAV